MYDLVLSHGKRPTAAGYRNRLLRGVLGSLGTGVYFSWGIKLVEPAKITVADRCQFSNSTILQGTGGLAFGESCLIGFENIFLTMTHRSDDLGVPVRDQGYFQEPVALGDNVWTGCRVTVLPGVTIGSHSIIASGSVVTRDVPEGVVAAGVPARVVKGRSVDA